MRRRTFWDRIRKLEEIISCKDKAQAEHIIMPDPDGIWRVWVCPVGEGCDCGGFMAEWKDEPSQSSR